MPCGASARVGRDLPAVGRQSSCDRTNDLLVEAVEMWHQLQPEGHLVGPIVVSDARLEPDM